MTTEDQPADGYAARIAFARAVDPADAERRTHVTLQVVLVTLAWLVVVPILVGFGLTGAERDGGVLRAAAFLIVLGPFVAAVIGTRNHRFGIGGAYTVLTLLMVLPAVFIARLG
ncbi:MAG: hypothetical protein ABW022_05065 [Actinoplanes sp.]